MNFPGPPSSWASFCSWFLPALDLICGVPSRSRWQRFPRQTCAPPWMDNLSPASAFARSQFLSLLALHLVTSGNLQPFPLRENFMAKDTGNSTLHVSSLFWDGFEAAQAIADLAQSGFSSEDVSA